MTSTPRQDKVSPSSSPRSRMKRILLTAAITLAVFLMLIDILSPLRAGWLLATQVVELSDEYQASITANRALAAHNEFLQKEAGLEWATRRHKGLVHPGERVLSLTEQVPEDNVPVTRQERWQAWIENVETRAAEWITKQCAVLQCYAKLRELDQPPAATAASESTAVKDTAEITEGENQPAAENEQAAEVSQEGAG